ncbi:acyl CoA:acetate/3-ketoacid CoA transferase [Pelomyxa schiedti]|nr:acyl CoA:acetate/3-ketoacid CoA transferase [Pelomyxa schiedti]
MEGKVTGAVEALQHIRDGDTVVIGGYAGAGHAEYLMLNLERIFLESGLPRRLTLMWFGGPGDGKDRGVNHLAHEGLVDCCIGAHWANIPKIQKLVASNKVSAFNLPLGVMLHMLRNASAGLPYTLSRVGLGTFVDPRLNGGKLNSITTKDMVNLVTHRGEEFLSYDCPRLNVAILRGTTSDLEGNISVEHEIFLGEALTAAIAVKCHGGIVIVQVERIAASKTIPRALVRIPGNLVDFVVVAPPEHHWQTFGTTYSPLFSGELVAPLEPPVPLQMGVKKIIGRRAAQELFPNSLVTFGVGMPESLWLVALEDKVRNFIVTNALGVYGGIPQMGKDFGASINGSSAVDPAQQFDLIHGGGLDIAFLGMAQADRFGNVNVSKFSSTLVGTGAFIDITASTKKLVFMGSFTAIGLTVGTGNDVLTILTEGKVRKFMNQVEQVSFSGPTSFRLHPRRLVLYITERCVFRLCETGLELCEIAPGITVESLIEQMGFTPAISSTLAPMPPHLFT